MKNFVKILLASTALTLAACGGGEKKPEAATVMGGMPAYEYIQGKLMDAKPGDVIELPAGRFAINRTLSLTVDGVTIKGAGHDKTVLDFANQKTGAEGLLVTASDFTIEDIGFEDTIGDSLKVNEGKNIIIRRVRTEWTNGPDTKNGAYGIYPVQTENVLLEENIAIAAADAGIYVGQSKNVIVRNNTARFNVAGIEIENTVYADVYDNIAEDNTGGILVFNMPALQQDGHTTRVYKNVIKNNNTKNFGHAGTPVASVPAGSGIVINSNDKIEIFDNVIHDNKTANIIISSVFTTNYNKDAKSDYDPYPEAIYIYNNDISGGGNAPDGMDLKALKTLMFGLNGRLPDVLWDGYYDEAKFVDGNWKDENRFCIQNGDVEVLNADAPNEFKNPKVMSKDFTDCELAKLAPVKLTGSLAE